MDHAHDIFNHLPEAGSKSPAAKAGAAAMDIDTMVEVFGAKAWYYDNKHRRTTVTDMPGKRAIYVGRSPVISGGHRIIPIEWDIKRQTWSLGPTIDRSYVKVINDEFPLRTVPAKGVDPKQLDLFVDKLSPAAYTQDVYVVEKVTAMRVKGDEVEYRVKWKGWGSKDNTWEPRAHLVDYGAMDSVAKWHADNPDRPDPHSVAHAIMFIQHKDEDERAVESLVKKHKLNGTVSDWVGPYQKEMQKVISKRCREIVGTEYNRVLKQEKVVPLRMNPEPKKDGGRKMRLLVKGFLEPKEWDSKTDSPTVLASTVKQLIAMGIEVDVVHDADPDDEES